MKNIKRNGTVVFIALFVIALTIGFSTNSPQIVSAAGGVGATLPYTEVQAENSSTNGTIIGPDRFYPSLAGEAIERRARHFDRDRAAAAGGGDNRGTR